MPLSQLDPHAALIVIDLQKGILALPLAHPATEILGRSAALAQAFRQHNLPVILVNVDASAPGRTDTPRPRFTFPADWTELAPELDHQPSDHLITKHRIGAFLGTDLDKILRSHDVTQVFFTGIATTNGVEASARSAHDLGFNVVIVSDAVTDRDLAAHTYALEKVFPRIAEVDSTANVLKAFTQRAPQ